MAFALANALSHTVFHVVSCARWLFSFVAQIYTFILHRILCILHTDTNTHQHPHPHPHSNILAMEKNMALDSFVHP